ncbi:SE-domain-containing protein [Gonapodya prolifera JEL478]|uniref:Squalene monooxygenase n=1 Tax=Gonapodya prolifera (strain JEL478) TaxID=1344416 RepID=A0A139AM87_GONPJ|nr:SE-domain-containing protein [Gonapodya prolifera JEL478]|eukprot:KXS17881.1 SE-domain-containing protein [Gonapodya prolifera JEL478]
MSRRYDVIVIGAGIVGNPLAVVLANQGKSVLLLERDLSEPDRIVGELLQPGGVHSLRAMGLGDCLEGINAAPCYGYKVIIPGTDDASKAPHPDNILRSHDAVLGQNVGYGFHHGRFIRRLRERATTTEGVTTLEGTCTSLIKDDSTGQIRGVNVSVKGRGEDIQLFASLTVVADGCFSKFRRDYISTPVVVKGHFVGIELRNCPLPGAEHGNVVLGNPSPVLFYAIGKYAGEEGPVDQDGNRIWNEIRALIDIPGTDMKKATGGDLKGYLETKILPQLPLGIQPSFRKALATSRLRSMPNQYLPAPTQYTTFPPGLILVGDSQNMRHPLTGGGMTVAFEDVRILGEEMANLKPAELSEDSKVRSVVRTWMQKRLGVSGVVNVLAMALYDLFAAGDDPNLKTLRNATFAYFEVGGNCVTGPVSLLAGILKSPLSLVSHFFAVAVYGTYIMVREGGILKAPFSLVRSATVLWRAASIIAPLGWKEGWAGLR